MRRLLVPVLVLVLSPLAGCAVPAAPAPPEGAPQVPVALACGEACRTRIMQGAGWEPHAAVNPLDPEHVLVGSTDVRFDGGTFRTWLYAHVSRDGGRTWTSTPLPGGPGTDPRHPLAAATHTADPIVAFLPDGTALYLGMFTTAAWTPAAGGSRGFSLFLARSTDGGLTWPEASIVAEGEGAAAFLPFAPLPLQARHHDRPSMAVGPDGTVLVTWGLMADGTRLSFAHSADGGRTWSEYAPLWPGGDASGAHPLVASDGAWHVAFMGWSREDAFREGRFDLHLATSRDRGVTWDVQALGETAFFPFLAELPGSGGASLALAHPLREAGAPQVPVLRVSTEGGATWTSPRALDAPGDEEVPALPTLAVDGRGLALVTYFRAEGGRVEHRAVAAHPAPLAVGSPLVLEPDAGASPAALGDYMGLAPLPAGAFAAWTSQAEGASGVYGARIVPDA